MPTAKHKSMAKVAARTFEEAASLLDTMRFPLVRKQYDRVINRVYSDARWLRVYSGGQRKKYKRIVDGKKILEV